MRSRSVPIARNARRITFRMQTTDVRKYAVTETVRRTRAAVERAGGQLIGGVRPLPIRTRRWCVLRSPHVNKKSREHFWMRSHRRDFDWDAPIGVVPDDAEVEIAAAASYNFAVRVTVDAPGIHRLRELWATLGQARKQRELAQANEDGESSEASKVGLASALPESTCTVEKHARSVRE